MIWRRSGRRESNVPIDCGEMINDSNEFSWVTFPGLALGLVSSITELSWWESSGKVNLKAK